MFQFLSNNCDFRSQTRIGNLFDARIQQIAHLTPSNGGSRVPCHQEVREFCSRTFHQKLASTSAFLFGRLFSQVAPSLNIVGYSLVTQCVGYSLAI